MTEDATAFVVDDDPAVCDSLEFLLDSAGIAASSYPSAERFLAAFSPDVPGCVVADVKLPEMDGLQLVERMRDRGWRTPVIVVTAHGSIATAVKAMRLGAFDFIEKPVDDRELLVRVKEAINSDCERREHHALRDEIAIRLCKLSARENEVLDLVVAGEPTKSIAATLGTSFNTVQNQRASILRKMQARSVADLVRMVMVARSDRY